jgi:hypothetical protein
MIILSFMLINIISFKNYSYKINIFIFYLVKINYIKNFHNDQIFIVLSSEYEIIELFFNSLIP